MSAVLLGIDLEDVRDWVKDGFSYREAVPDNTRRYLGTFAAWGVKATFFIVGEVARRYPKLIAEIADAGHEIACHGDKHLQLDKLSPQNFRNDLKENVHALQDAGGKAIHGFRAPTFSLTKETAWAHEVLAELGFTYSSSVLPARNPLYGWPEFGREAKEVFRGFWELPITLQTFLGLSTPVAGGVYFRVLPFLLTKWSIGRTVSAGRPVLTYFHPYDIDLMQERFMHPDLGDSRYLNMLMYIGRKKVFSRLDALRGMFPFLTYNEYVVNCLAADAGSL
jgi:polysaccharide deacetylase family protein (PEP-CTERM system associated)